MDVATMVGRFGLDHISLGGPVFDTTKLDWLNGRYIRERLDASAFSQRVGQWALNEPYLEAIAPLAQSRIERLSDLGPLASFLFAGRLHVAKEAFLDGKLDDETIRKLFVLALDEFDRLDAWDVPAIEAALRRLATETGVKFRDLVRPFYVAVSGSPTSLPLFNSMQLLGRDIVRERVRNALDTLGGATAPQRFRLVILPLLMPAAFLALILRMMDAFRVFDIIFVSTSGGPADATNTLMIYGVKQGLEFFNIGAASAVSTVIVVCILIMAAAFIAVLKPARNRHA